MKVSEYVSLGHPDKVCDYISERILDEYIKQDPKTRYALEVQAKDNYINLAGEITSTANVNVSDIAKAALAEIGYTEEYRRKWGDENTISDVCAQVSSRISKQSPDIAQGLSGWGDQGIFTGMAYNNVLTDYFFPDYFYAKELCNELFRSGIGGLDIKTQVYMTDDYSRVEMVVVAIPLLHDEDKKFVSDLVHKIIPGDFKLVINGTGRYVKHNTYGDCGVTGRKLAVDFYGGGCEVGGGSPWTKDGSKADLTLNMLARSLALRYLREHALPFVKCKLACIIGRTNVLISFYDEAGKLLSDGEYFVSPEKLIKQFGLDKPVFAELCRDGLFSKIK